MSLAPVTKPIAEQAEQPQRPISPIQVPATQNAYARKQPVVESGGADEFMSKEELCDREKKNCEAMEVLEKSTAEF